jgi:glucuronate isomerase
MNEDFLLTNETAKNLYHHTAKDMPIYDYHCHLSADEILEDKKYENITELWLGGDHYKWRAMRTHGITEEMITGNVDNFEKFKLWADTVQHAFGNPLYHWTHLELKRYFDIHETLSKDNAKPVYEKINEQLKKDDLSVRGIIRKSNVKVICTTDDPVDDLYAHIKLKEEGYETKVLPTFRPDKAVNVELSWFPKWLDSLSRVVGYDITSLELLKQALIERIDFFHEVGCRLSDHALDVVMHQKASLEEVESIFERVLENKEISKDDLEKYKGHMLTFFGREYHKREWAMQLHIGAHRNNSKRMLENLGPDTGFDSIHDEPFASSLVAILDNLDSKDQLPRTIVYTLNPRDNEVVGTIIGSFQGSGIKGKIQFGSGWWFNDQLDGMTRQMEALSQLGMFSHFVGMLTDSRSFLSFTRHEYFRRLLCNRIGEYVENGMYPYDEVFLTNMVKNICYNNAVNYFSIDV